MNATVSVADAINLGIILNTPWPDINWPSGAICRAAVNLAQDVQDNIGTARNTYTFDLNDEDGELDWDRWAALTIAQQNLNRIAKEQ